MLTLPRQLPPDPCKFPLCNKSTKREATVFLGSTPNVALPQQQIFFISRLQAHSW
jgi:hypothetical protein